MHEHILASRLAKTMISKFVLHLHAGTETTERSDTAIIACITLKISTVWKYVVSLHTGRTYSDI